MPREFCCRTDSTPEILPEGCCRDLMLSRFHELEFIGNQRRLVEKNISIFGSQPNRIEGQEL